MYPRPTFTISMPSFYLIFFSNHSIGFLSGADWRRLRWTTDHCPSKLNGFWEIFDGKEIVFRANVVLRVTREYRASLA